MSELFGLSNIFTESNSYNVLSDVRYSESFVESAQLYLESLNKSFNDNTKDLYIKISEAVDKSCENDILCEYIKSVEKNIREFSSKIEEMVSRFIIKIDNIVDANSDILNNADLLNNIKPFSYRFYKFEKIDDVSYPKMNPLSVYNKEFDFIGQLLQDLGPGASNQDKLGVIATVYNTLNKSSKSNSVTKKCIKDILDDDCDIDKFARELYKEFKDDEAKDIVIDKSRLYDIKLSMNNYKNLENSGVVTAENLIKQFNEIGDKLIEIISGNKKNTLKIDTPTDGIKNTTYRLDTYSMNQLDLFMKTKINQVIEMINIYSVAMSIKLDAIVDYFEQCKDILHMAEMNSSDTDNANNNDTLTNNASSDTGDDTENDNDDLSSEEEEEPEDNEDDDEKNGDDPYEEDNMNSEESETSEDENNINTDTGDDYTLDDNKDINNNASEDDSITDSDKSEGNLDEVTDELPDLDDVKESCNELEMLVRDYQYQIATLCSIGEHFNMLSTVMSIVTEEDDPASGGQNNDTIGKVKELVNDTKDSVWKGIVNKVAELWNKFKSKMINMYDEKLKFLEDNVHLIKKKAIDFSPDSGKLMPVIHEDKLDINLPDLNYNTMKDDLKDEDTFFKKHFNGIPRKDGESINEAVKNMIIDPNNSYRNMNELNPVNLYEYCKNIPKKLDELQKNTAIMDKGRRNAEQIAKKINTTAESAMEETLKMYFNEGDYKSSDPKDDKKVSNMSDELKVYFKVCGNVLTAQMTCCQRIFKEYYQYLAEHIKRHGGSNNKDNKQKDSGDGKQENGSTGDVAFN